mgnify:CR=1 FL=1
MSITGSKPLACFVVAQSSKSSQNIPHMEKDRTKTRSSCRALPLVPPFEELLLRIKAQQAENCKLCGSMYCHKYDGYLYVDPG